MAAADDNPPTCVICCEDIDDPGSERMLWPGCKHSFHTKCALNAAQYNIRCPMCRCDNDDMPQREITILDCLQNIDPGATTHNEVGVHPVVIQVHGNQLPNVLVERNRAPPPLQLGGGAPDVGDAAGEEDEGEGEAPWRQPRFGATQQREVSLLTFAPSTSLSETLEELEQTLLRARRRIWSTYIGRRRRLIRRRPDLSALNAKIKEERRRVVLQTNAINREWTATLRRVWREDRTIGDLRREYTRTRNSLTRHRRVLERRVQEAIGEVPFMDEDSLLPLPAPQRV